MKMILMIFILNLFTGILTAPSSHTCFMSSGKVIKVFDPMLFAFMKVESNFDTDTINYLGYGGILQIGQEMIDEANRICKKQGIYESFTLTDRIDSTKSARVWYIVQTYWNEAYTLERACKVWNPRASKRYYNKIKIALMKI